MMSAKDALALVIVLLAFATTNGFAMKVTSVRSAVTTGTLCASGRTGRLLLLAKAKKGRTSKAKKQAGNRPILWAHTRTVETSDKTSLAKTDELWKLVLSGSASTKKVKALVRSGADVHRADREGYSLLHVACRSGLVDVVSALVEAGADVDAVGGGGAASPLHLAALGDHAAVVKQLLASGATIDKMDEGDVGGTALHYAANAGAHSVIDELLHGGASVHSTSGDGRSVAHFASFCTDPTVAEKLLAAGAPPLPRAAPWPRERPPLEILGDFDQYTEVQPRIEVLDVSECDLFAEHAVLSFDKFDGAQSGEPDGLVMHRFLVHDDDVRGSNRTAGAFDDALVQASLLVRKADPTGALRSNQGGYHSAATLRGRAEEPSCPCWGELHSILDAAVAEALKVEGHTNSADGALRVTDSWVNFNRGQGDFNKLHMHLPAVYSGVYYVQPPNDEMGRLNGAFVLPLTTRDGPVDGGGEDSEAAKAAHIETSEHVPSEVTFALMRPQRGMLLLFPASMLHAVLPSWSADGAGDEDKERISIGFNVSPFW